MNFLELIMKTEMIIYCCECNGPTKARLTDGKEIYPHREDLNALPFWKCDACKNFVGCHHKTTNRTWPLGNIPSKEIKDARIKIHALLDPLWKQGEFSRSDIYNYLSKKLGYAYHTAEIKTIEQARDVYRYLLKIKKVGIK